MFQRNLLGSTYTEGYQTVKFIRGVGKIKIRIFYRIRNPTHSIFPPTKEPINLKIFLLMPSPHPSYHTSSERKRNVQGQNKKNGFLCFLNLLRAYTIKEIISWKAPFTIKTIHGKNISAKTVIYSFNFYSRNRNCWDITILISFNAQFSNKFRVFVLRVVSVGPENHYLIFHELHVNHKDPIGHYKHL